MFCKSCGSPLPDDAAFCPSCGAKIAAEPAGEPDRQREKLLPLVCRSCGSGSLKRIREGEYLCEYCGNRFFMDGQGDSDADDREEAKAALAAIFSEAAEYEEKDDIRGELKTLIKGLKIAPENGSLMLRLGRAYWRLGFIREAQSYYQKAKELDPGDPIVYINFGALCLTQKQYQEAKEQLEKGLAIIEADPFSATANDIAVAYGNYALCIGELGDRKKAAEYLSVAKAKGYSPDSIRTICRRLHLRQDKL